MYIVIAGGGKVGSYLARRLVDHRNAVTVIEKDADTCRRLASSIDVLVVKGDACDRAFQEEAQVGRAHVFAAVTGDDDDNIVACQMAKYSFGVPRLVARVNNPKNEEIFNRMGIDAISSTTIIARMIESESTLKDTMILHVLSKGKLAVVELKIPSRGSGACGVEIKDMGLPQGCVLVSIVRGEDVIIPHGREILRPGDEVIAITTVEREADLRNILAGDPSDGKGEGPG